MNKEVFKKEFLTELAFFNMVCQKDLKKGFTIEQIEDELIKFTSSFYGARIDFDQYAVKKCYFIATYAYQIIKGHKLDEYLDELCNSIEEEKRIRGL